jgi:hypothetical protein
MKIDKTETFSRPKSPNLWFFVAAFRQGVWKRMPVRAMDYGH